MESGPTPPVVSCPVCEGVLKPDIVFFGEPVLAIAEAEHLVAECDLLLILGSSLQVRPASLLPHCTTQTTIVVNRGEVTLAPVSYRHFLDEDLEVFARTVAEHLGLND